MTAGFAGTLETLGLATLGFGVATTFTTDWLSGCERFRRYAGARSAQGTVVYGGNSSFQVLGSQVMSWRGFGELAATA